MVNREISFFELDSTLWENDYKVWVIDKNNPSKPVIILNSIEFALIKNGKYKKDDIKLKYNGQHYFIGEELKKKIQKKVKTDNMERFGISLMPMVDRNLLNNSEVKYLLNNIIHLSNKKFIDMGILTARSNQRNNSDMINKLRLELKNIGIDIKKIYFVGNSVFKGQNYVNKIVVLLEHLVGFKIKNGKFVALKQDWYPIVNFYDDDPQNINYANDIQNLFDKILRKTDDEILHIIMERLNTVKLTLNINQVTSNDINKFISSKVILKPPIRFPIMERRLLNYKNFKSIIQ